MAEATDLANARSSSGSDSDHSFTHTAENAASIQQELPPGVWREVLAHLPTQQEYVASMVCRAWRSLALDLLTNSDLVVCLNSGAAAVGFAAWLAAHGHKLQSLTLTEHFFSHHPPAYAAAAAAAAGHQQGTRMRSRLGPIARVALWQGLHAGGKPLPRLHTLKVFLDDISVTDAVAVGLCVMPALTHLTLESNASAIGVTGAAGLVTLTTLRELNLPTQALGDQGLQYLGSSLVRLASLSVHNDGHVTDDGMAALGGLTNSLTALDLQGNVSITQAAMPVLAAVVPRLRHLNLAWLSSVNDWGLGQLSSLRDMQQLNLRATGVQLETAAAASAIQAFTALTHLNISRCNIKAAGIAALCGSSTSGSTTTPALSAALSASMRELDLSENSGMVSYTELRPLLRLTALTRLDLSSPAAAMRQPNKNLTVVAELTQLRHLALNQVLDANQSMEWLQRPPSVAPPQRADGGRPTDISRDAELSASLARAGWGPADAAANIRVMHRDLLLAAETLAAAVWGQQQQQGAAAVAAAPAAQPSQAAAAAVLPPAGSDDAQLSPWAELILSLPSLTRLTALEFAGNVATVATASYPDQAYTLGGAFAAPRLLEPALVLLAFAAAQHTALRALHFATPARPAGASSFSGTEHQQQREQQGGGVLRGHWKVALPCVAAAMLSALGCCVRPGVDFGLEDAGQLAGVLRPQQQQQQQQQGAVEGQGQHAAGTMQQQLGQLLDSLQHRVQECQQQQLQHQQEAGGSSSSTTGPSLPSRQESELLTPSEAAQLLRLLLPNLGLLQFDW